MPLRRSSKRSRSSLKAMKPMPSLLRSNTSTVKRKPLPTKKITRWSRKRRKTKASQMRVLFRKRHPSMLRKSLSMQTMLATLRSQPSTNRSSCLMTKRNKLPSSRTARVATKSKRRSMQKSRYLKRKMRRSLNNKSMKTRWKLTKMSFRMRSPPLPVRSTLSSLLMMRRKQKLKTRVLRSGAKMRRSMSNPLQLKRPRKRL